MIQEVLSISSGLGKILQQDFPVLTSYKLSKIAKVLRDELVPFEETRKKLFEKYGEQDEKSNQLKIKDDQIGNFQEEMNKVLTQEVELNIETIDVKELGTDIKLKPVDLIELDKILTSEK